MTFTNKDYEYAAQMQRVTGLLNFRTTPPTAGGYQMDKITFNLTKKPRWIHRMGVRLVLGWKWVDA